MIDTLVARRKRCLAKIEKLRGELAALDRRIGKELGRLLPKAPKLTARQREVVQLVRQNASNKEIAAALNISVRGVKFHVSALLEIFGVASRHDLSLPPGGKEGQP